MKIERNTKEGVLACNATAMRKASRRVAQLYDDALAPCGLRSTQFAILAELHERTDRPPTLAELAAALVVDRSALGHNLRPLERDGFVTLQPGVEDRRRRHIVLTEPGRAKLQHALGLWEAAQDRFHAIFGQTEAEALRGALLDIAYDDRLGTLKD
jgi:DNA-binding MarR family transcriptional regulator